MVRSRSMLESFKSGRVERHEFVCNSGILVNLFRRLAANDDCRDTGEREGVSHGLRHSQSARPEKCALGADFHPDDAHIPLCRVH